MLKSIYLAGKIEPKDWRTSIISGEPYGKWSYDVYSEHVLSPNYPWPVCPNAIFGKYDYVGPFFVDCGHACFFGDDEHGVGASSGGENSEGWEFEDTRQAREITYRRCMDALVKADLVFAWIDSADCYGTIAEISYAKALQKIVWIAGRKAFRDLWFVYEMADRVDYYDHRNGPEGCLKSMLNRWELENPALESPIEVSFWKEWVALTDNDHPYQLVPQHSIGRYRVDFAYPPAQIAIELDGHATHSSPDAIAYDRRRQREIEDAGWKVVRFGGKEVWVDASQCAKETLSILNRFVLKQRVDTGLSRMQKMQEGAKEPPRQSNIPALTIAQVEEYWPSIKRRCRDKKGGAKIAALLNGCTIVSVEGTSVLPVIVLRAKGSFVYNCLAQNTSQYASLEWAVKTELGRECKVRLLEPTSILPSLPSWDDVPLYDEGEEGRTK